MLRWVFFVLTTLLLVGCGGSESNLVKINILSPKSDSSFAPGEKLTLQLDIENFVLETPADKADAVLPYVGSLKLAAVLVKHSSENTEHAQEEASVLLEESEHSMDEHVEGSDIHDDVHSHSTSETNPDARAGHMHVYLNDASGSDAHVTTWSYETPIVIPSDLAPGTHSLRLELRDSHHTIVNPVYDAVLFFEVVHHDHQ